MQITIRCSECRAILFSTVTTSTFVAELYVEPCPFAGRRPEITTRPELIAFVDNLIAEGSVAFFSFTKLDGSARQLRGRPLTWNTDRHGGYTNILVSTDLRCDDDDNCLRSIRLDSIKTIDADGVCWTVAIPPSTRIV